MDSTDSKPPEAGDAIAPKPHRRWFQFGLRTLLLVIALCAVGAFAWRTYVEPYRQQRQTMELIARLGGGYETVEAPAWLRRIFGSDFQNVSLVNLADCDDPPAYLGAIAELPKLETLAVGGRAFTDQHLQMLRRAPALSYLVLDSTAVSDEAVAALQQPRPALEVYFSDRRAIDALAASSRVEFDPSEPPQDAFARLSPSLLHSLLLRCSSVRLSDDTPDDAVAHLQGMRRLRELRLDSERIADAALLHIRALTELELLCADVTRITGSGFEHLNGLKKLRWLRFNNTPITDEGLSRLHLPGLQGLSVDYAQISDAGLAHLKEFTGLEDLSVRGAGISDAGLKHLGALTELKSLDISGKGIARLQELALSETKITDAGLSHLKPCSELRSLDLMYDHVTDAGMVHLCELPRLEYLDLHATQISDGGLACLNQLANLRFLVVSGTRMGNAGLSHLQKAPNLEFLDVWQTKVTDEGVAEFQRARPECRVQRSTAGGTGGFAGAATVTFQLQPQGRILDLNIPYRGLLFLALITLALPAAAQDLPPLKWGADADGGIPYAFTDADGNPAGFEVDLARALEKELGRKINFYQRAFDSLVPDVNRGDIDFAMNGMEITPEQQERVRFTRPYYIYHLQLITRQGEDRFTTIEQCKEHGYTVATLGASAAYRLLEKLDVPRKSYDDQDGPFRDLQRGFVDAVLFDLPIAIYYAVPDPTIKHARRYAGLQFTGRPFAEGYYGIALKKENAQLAEQLDAALGRVIESGALKRILMKWELWNHDQYRLYKPTKAEAGEVEQMSIGVYLPLLLEGAEMTVLITLAGMALAVLLGLPISMARLYGPPPLQWLATIYVEFFRGIPILLLLYFLYYGLPAVVPAVKLGPLEAAILGFGLNYAAYEAEIYRAGIGAIPLGQWEAAASLGMPSPLTFRRIILPQALATILPPMTNDLVALFKDTSVVSIIAVVELSKQYQILTKSYGGFVQIGITTAALYLVMSVPLGFLSRRLEKKWAGGA